MDKRAMLACIVLVFALGWMCVVLVDHVQRQRLDAAMRDREAGLLGEQLRGPPVSAEDLFPAPAGSAASSNAAPPISAAASVARKADEIPQIYRDRSDKVFKEYLELHRKIMDPTDTSVPKKFFINTRCHWGLGNFQIRTIGGFLIALLTKRAFIQQDRMYNSYYRYPIPNMTMGDEDLQRLYGGSSETAAVCEPGQWRMCADFEENWRDPANPMSPPSPFAKSTTKFFGGVPWFIYANPVYGQFMKETFGKYFFHLVGKFLLSDVANEDILAYKRHEEERLYGSLGIKPEDQYRIGMQIRWGRGLDDFYLSDIKKDPDKFWRCAEPWLLENEAKGKKGVIFLATDHMGIRNWTVEHFQNRNPPIPVLHISAEVAPESAKHMALVDQMFLQDTDDMIVTQRSTFGFFPYAVGLHTPKVVHRIWADCQPFEHSQTGQVTRGGSWPWGTTVCHSAPCCSEAVDEITALFGQLV